MYRTHLCGLIIASAILPATATAQPYSDSMADCSGIVSASLDFVETADRRTAIETMVTRLTDAAFLESALEGRADAGTVIPARIATTRQEWRDKGAQFVFSQDFRDWMDYCRSFARARGVDLAS